MKKSWQTVAFFPPLGNCRNIEIVLIDLKLTWHLGAPIEYNIMGTCAAMSVASIVQKVETSLSLRPAPQLITVTTTLQRFTQMRLTKALAAKGIRHQRWGYEQLFLQQSLPRATYIFTDFDRMHPWWLELSAQLRERLVSQGLTVLNDPRKFVPRAALLRRLYQDGTNGFDCWLPVQGEWPDRYPVFLRTIHAHRGVESELLHSKDQASAALNAAMARGLVVSDLAFVEYAADADATGGVFRKHACFCIGGAIVRGLTVNSASWVAKIGTAENVPEAQYAQDLAEQTDYPHQRLMQQVFDKSGIEFGRLDFGMVGGTPQIYEINSNPFFAPINYQAHPMRIKASLLSREAVVAKICEFLPEPSRARVDISDIVKWGRQRRKSFGQP